MTVQGQVFSAQVWHLAQLKPNGAALATRNLLRQGYEVFNPKHMVSKRRGTTFVRREEQLFPGYLFVGLSHDLRRWGPINGTLGVARLVGFGGSAAVVPAQLIDELQHRCDDQGKITLPNDLVAGDTIKVLAGPFAEFVTKVERIDGQQRVWVLLDLLGQAAKVQLARAAVVKL
jgi:transcriptional antiterminator RfaH